MEKDFIRKDAINCWIQLKMVLSEAETTPTQAAQVDLAHSEVLFVACPCVSEALCYGPTGLVASTPSLEQTVHTL